MSWRTRLRSARWLWIPLLSFGLTRMGIALVAYLAAPLMADSTPPPYHLRPPDSILLDVFGSRWDTGFYVSIAEEGYKYRGVALPSVAFFPLLPLLIRAGTWLVGDSLVAGLLVTNIALLGGAMFLYQLAEEDWGSAVADRTVWYLLIFPTSFFGSAIYSESLFLLGATGALYLARKGAWESAALLGIMTALTRLVGIVVAPMLLLEWWSQRRRTEGSRPSRGAFLASAIVPLGTAGYMLYLQQAFGDPLAFVHAAAAWERAPQSPLALINELIVPFSVEWDTALRAGFVPLNNWIDLLAIVLFVVLGSVLLVQRRWSEGILVVLGSIVPLSSGLLLSQRRYVWVLFPAFILLARWGARPWVDRAITGFSLLGLSLSVALFANGYWVG